MNIFMISATGLVVAIGAALAFQAPINAALARSIGDPVWAAALSFGVGFVLLAGVAMMRDSSLSLTQLTQIPWWALIGGALGAIWVLAAIWSVTALGAMTMFAAMILGQMIAALLIDSAGLLGLATRDISATRLAAIVCVGFGVVLSYR
ncbi:MAG: DMT family transporter [Pseudomonadota bacterium]